MAEPAIFVVGTQVPPEQENKFNKWYNENHIPILMKSKLLDGVARYKLSPTPDIERDFPAEGGHPPYLALYYFKGRQAFEAWWNGPDLAASKVEMKESGWDIGKNFFVRRLSLYEPIKSWQK